MVTVGVTVRPKKMNWPVADGSDVVFTLRHKKYMD